MQQTLTLATTVSELSNEYSTYKILAWQNLHNVKRQIRRHWLSESYSPVTIRKIFKIVIPYSYPLRTGHLKWAFIRSLHWESSEPLLWSLWQNVVLYTVHWKKKILYAASKRFTYSGSLCDLSSNFLYHCSNIPRGTARWLSCTWQNDCMKLNKLRPTFKATCSSCLCRPTFRAGRVAASSIATPILAVTGREVEPIRFIWLDVVGHSSESTDEGHALVTPPRNWNVEPGDWTYTATALSCGIDASLKR